VVRTPSGQTVAHLDQAPIGSPIAARTTDGWIDATVTGHRKQKLNEAPGEYRV
jgi:hypothetical protein